MVRLVQRAELDPRRVPALLIRAAVQLAIDKARDRRQTQTIARLLAPNLEAQLTAPEDALMLQADATRVLAALRALPRRGRQVLAMRILGELSVGETAAALGISVSTVEGAYTRGVQTVRARLGCPR